MVYQRPDWLDDEVLCGATSVYRRVQDAPVPAAGANGMVFKALDGKGRTVAVKIFSPRDQLSPAEIQLLITDFRNEAKKTAAMSHWGIVQILDVGTRSDGTPFSVFPWMQSDLRGVLDSGELGMLDRLLGCAQLAEAVAHVNERGLIHRDIKPENILVPTPYRFLLADLGIAELRDDFEATALRGLELEPEQNDKKHPRYHFSPEQMARAQGTGAKVDLSYSDRFQVGTICHEVLFGYHPLATPRTTFGPLPDPITRVVWMALEKTPQRRPSLGNLSAILHQTFIVLHEKLVSAINRLKASQRTALRELFARPRDVSAECLHYLTVGLDDKWFERTVMRNGDQWSLSPLGIDLRNVILGTEMYSGLMGQAERLGRVPDETITTTILDTPEIIARRKSDMSVTVDTDSALGRLIVRPMKIGGKWWVEAHRLDAVEGAINFSPVVAIVADENPAAAVAKMVEAARIKEGQQILLALVLQPGTHISRFSSLTVADQLASLGSRVLVTIKNTADEVSVTAIANNGISDSTLPPLRFSRTSLQRFSDSVWTNIDVVDWRWMIDDGDLGLFLMMCSQSGANLTVALIWNDDLCEAYVKIEE